MVVTARRIRVFHHLMLQTKGVSNDGQVRNSSDLPQQHDGNEHVANRFALESHFVTIVAFCVLEFASDAVNYYAAVTLNHQIHGFQIAL